MFIFIYLCVRVENHGHALQRPHRFVNLWYQQLLRLGAFNTRDGEGGREGELKQDGVR